MGDPRVLVLDEPANGLDPQGIRWLRDLLRSQADKGRAVLISSHVLAEVAQTVDDIVVISGGRSVLQQPLDRMLAEHVAGVRVAGPDSRLLGEILRTEGARRAGIHRHPRPQDRRERSVATHQLVISELSPAGSSLEDIYLELTGNPDGDPS
ncbi:MAG TPA: hypothetical protein VLW50_30395 [Streptosporangiaceae bacterium]|nr:hypothetical protein [Streptosporangiaceae bacterium]